MKAYKVLAANDQGVVIEEQSVAIIKDWPQNDKECDDLIDEYDFIISINEPVHNDPFTLGGIIKNSILRDFNK
jgi:hypothetical protein